MLYIFAMKSLSHIPGGPAIQLGHVYVADGDVDAVTILVKSGRVRPEQLICFAAMCGEADIVSALIELGADPNTHSRAGVPALVYAAEADSIDCLSALVRAGARTNGIVDSDRQFQQWDNVQQQWTIIPATGTPRVLIYKLCGRVL